MMCEKLSHAERREWNLGRSGEIEIRGLNVFGDWLREIANSYGNAYESVKKYIERPYRVYVHETIGSVSNITSSYERKSQYQKCQQQHDLSECPEFRKLSATKMKEFLMEERLCFGCFKENYVARNCLSNSQKIWNRRLLLETPSVITRRKNIHRTIRSCFPSRKRLRKEINQRTRMVDRGRDVTEETE